MDPSQTIPRKVLSYVAKDSPTKIKSYVRKHRLDLNGCCTPAGASVLHLAAELGSELCLRYLMKAYPSLLDKPDGCGELPLHKAATCLVTVTDRAHVMHVCLDVLEPLLAAQPQALRMPNYSGRTPRDILRGSGWRVVSGKLSRNTPGANVDDDRDQRDSRAATEQEDFFYEKLFDNMDDEDYFNSFDEAPDREEQETYDRWADRIDEQRRQKRRQHFEQHERRGRQGLGQEAAGNRQPPPCPHPGGDSGGQRKRVLGPERPKRLAASLQLPAAVKRARHETAMQRALQRPADAPPLGLAEFPWPTGSGSTTASAADMVSILLCDVDMTDVGAVRARAKELQKTWHPDKIEQRFGAALLQSARATILDKVKEIAQLLNAHMQQKS